MQQRTMQAPRLSLLLGAVVLCGLLFFAGCRLPWTRDTSPPSATSEFRPEAYCPLDGLPTTRNALRRRPLAVMVENSPAARPQSGLRDACVVYEAITEGGITRFLAVYLHGDPATIGPVRSARPHFINLAREYRAAYVHCGQSYEALQLLVRDRSIYHIDQLRIEKPFWRDRSRRAPHNLYTSFERLRKQMAVMGGDEMVTPLPKFSSARRIDSGRPAAVAELRFPGATSYRLRLVYDENLGGYQRYMDGKLHVDRETKEPIVAKNVIVQRVYTALNEQSKFGTYDVEVVGSGNGIFLSGGQQMPLRWEKPFASAITTFTDVHNGDLPFQPGQTWVEIIPTDGVVTITNPPPGR